MAIETSIYYLRTVFDTDPLKLANMVVFSVSMSTLPNLDNCGQATRTAAIAATTLDLHYLIDSYGIDITMQWIPGHSNTPGNDRVDRLAKVGSGQAQPPKKTSFNAAKQIIRSKNVEELPTR